MPDPNRPDPIGDDRLLVLYPSVLPHLAARIEALSPRLHAVSRDVLKENPALLERVEIAFGGLRGEQLRAARRLRWYQAEGAGVNGLLSPELRERGVMVTNTSGIHAEAIAEHLFGMLLMAIRCLGEARDQQRLRIWNGFPFPEHVTTLRGRTLGILGAGAIGGQCAEVGRAFRMRVLGLNRTGRPHPAVERMYRPGERLELLAECDVVMNLLPLTRATERFLGAAELAAMRDGSILLNAGRGRTVDTDALLAALPSGRPAAALLDVTDPEPLPPDHPLWTAPGVFITPHYAGNHPGYMDRAAEIFLENLQRFLDGRPLVNLVNLAEGY
jgi:phosphoglycerate dehydrogenase-like enzyme